MIRLGVSMDEKASRRPGDRPLFVDLLVIGAVLVALMYGGLQLLGRTHLAWADRYGSSPKPTPAVAPPRQGPGGNAWTVEQEAEYQRLRAEMLERRLKHEGLATPGSDAQPMRNQRCIDGVLFAEVDGAITNIGRCPRGARY